MPLVSAARRPLGRHGRSARSASAAARRRDWRAIVCLPWKPQASLSTLQGGANGFGARQRKGQRKKESTAACFILDNHTNQTISEAQGKSYLLDIVSPNELSARTPTSVGTPVCRRDLSAHPKRQSTPTHTFAVSPASTDTANIFPSSPRFRGKTRGASRDEHRQHGRRHAGSRTHRSSLLRPHTSMPQRSRPQSIRHY